MGRIRFFISCLLIIFVIGETWSQQPCSFEHYSTDDGLPQYNVNDMLQDQKGFIWLATSDGISKFDGYNFHNYKTKPGDQVQMKSNRIVKLYEDSRNRIWMQNYNDEPYCFDPKTEMFWGLQVEGNLSLKGFLLSRIETKPSGLVWLLSNNYGCICIADSLYSPKVLTQENGKLPSNEVLHVFEDNEGNSWLLTGNGLALIPEGQFQPSRLFFQLSDTIQSTAISFNTAIELDEEIWFGGSNGFLAKYSKRGKSFRSSNLEVGSEITHLELLSENNVLIVTVHDGFLTYNLFTGEFEHFNPIKYKNLNTHNLHLVHVEKPNQVWFVGNNELNISKLDLTNKKVSTYRVETNDATAATFPNKAFVLDDANGQLWVQPFGGGFSRYNEGKDSLEPFYNAPSSATSRFSNIVHSALIDRQGNLWFCSKSHGLDKVVFNKNPFHSLNVAKPSQPPGTKDARAFFEDRHGNRWVSTKENRIVIYNQFWQKQGCLSPSGNLVDDARWPNAAYTITSDNNENVWIGTKGNGLYKLTPKNKAFSFHTEHFTHDPLNPFSLSNKDIYSVFQDRQQRIWIATFGGGLNLIEELPGKQIRFIHARNLLKKFPIENYGRVRQIAQDDSGNIWLGTTGGLITFNPEKEQVEEISFQQYNKSINNTENLPVYDIIDICISADGNIYMGTSGGGISKVKTFNNNGLPVSFEHFTKNEGLPSDMIVSIIEDLEGMLWIGTENDLLRLDPQTRFVEVFTEAKRLLAGNNFSEATKYRLKSGELLLGHSDGLLHFFPNQIKQNQFAPYLSLSNFLLFNKRLPIGNSSPLSNSLDDIKKIVLNHKQNHFSIEYAALDYNNPKNISYAYMLMGFDKDWNYVQKQRVASYTNIPYGEYVFMIKSTNSDGVWTDNIRTLPIYIKPSFWKTPLAYGLYFMLFALIVFLVDYNLLVIYRLKTNALLQKKMSDMKLKFFTDISHEIRTPLTMITSPVDYLLNDNDTPEKIKKQLSFISHNTGRMLRLVNQILDIRKLQDQPLKITKIDLVQFVDEVCSDFIETAEKQQIDFQVVKQAKYAVIWADRDCLDKMIMNLLSNAFKFTHTGGYIKVSIQKTNNRISLAVSDNGQGISKEKLKKLFVRFASFNVDDSKPSTGIGLSLIKELADKHHASIAVESEPGNGSSFTLTFLQGCEHFNPEQIQNQTTDNLLEEDSNTKRISTEGTVKKEKPKILLVEDDPELRAFISSIIEEEYQILEAEDGVEGLQKAIDQNPDFIVSDIMMPRKDGIALLKELRQNINTSHIPIILLTAKTTIESKLEGLNYGADDYITKPFSVPYFKARIENLIQQRRRLQEIYSHNLVLNQVNKETVPFMVSPHDDELMKKVASIVESNLDNGDLTIEEIASSVGLGRTTFFNKLKSLTGMPPVEFVRDMRIQHAAKLLADGNYLIKEVAYMTGFSDLKYFGKCFKSKYNKTPVQFRKKTVLGS